MGDEWSAALMSQRIRGLAAIEAFKDLSPSERDELEGRLELVAVSRGEFLVRQGQPAKALYIAVSGRFSVLLDGVRDPVAIIGSGQPIGEIAFFAQRARTASVRADRDSLALRLTRDDFDVLAERLPALLPVVMRALANRLAVTTASGETKPVVRPRTICLCAAGNASVPKIFVERLRSMFIDDPRAVLLDRETVERHHGGLENLEGTRATEWFNDLERRFETIFYVADDDLTAWTQKALHQSDEVLCVAWHDAGGGGRGGRNVNDVERAVSRIHNRGSARLVLLHHKEKPISGTARWLKDRPHISMHHHIAIQNHDHFARLMRFVRGEAVGLVACGGGAYTAAHIGQYQALREDGFSFDIMGGTSGGAAMTAAFALGVPVDEISRRTHEMFVKRGAMARWTWPRFSFLDHTIFNAVLAEHYTEIAIEDMWIPYFAAATNLTLHEIYPIRRGPVWQAIRASASIPALFPPVYNDDGQMLVDGCLLDNLPVRTIKALKTGPNVILDLDAPRDAELPVDHRLLPSRAALLWRQLLPNQNNALPVAAGPQTVLVRSLLVNQRDVAGDVGPDDLVLCSPIPADASVLDWTRHRDLRWSAYDYARAELSKVRVAGHGVFAAADSTT